MGLPLFLLQLVVDSIKNVLPLILGLLGNQVLLLVFYVFLGYSELVFSLLHTDVVLSCA